MSAKIVGAPKITRYTAEAYIQGRGATVIGLVRESVCGWVYDVYPAGSTAVSRIEVYGTEDSRGYTCMFKGAT